MKIGTKVRSLISNNVGYVVMLTKNKQFVMINCSDISGVAFRWIRIDRVVNLNE